MKYLKIFTDFSECLKELDEAAIGRLFLAMLRYAETGIVPTLTGDERVAFPFAKIAIDKQFKSYNNKVNAAAIARASSDNTLISDDISIKQDVSFCNNPQHSVSNRNKLKSRQDNDNDNDNDNDKDNDKDKDNEEEKDNSKDNGNSFTGEDVLHFTPDSNSTFAQDAKKVIEKWNSLGLCRVLKVDPSSMRGKLLRARLREYGLEKVLAALDNVAVSDFCKGSGSNGWVIDFDWFIGPNNFVKVLEGKYNHQRSSRRSVNDEFDPSEIDSLKISV